MTPNHPLHIYQALETTGSGYINWQVKRALGLCGSLQDLPNAPGLPYNTPYSLFLLLAELIAPELEISSEPKRSPLPPNKF